MCAYSWLGLSAQGAYPWTPTLDLGSSPSRSAPTPCLITNRSGRLLLCSISSPTFFMSNPPRSPEGFEVSGRTSKDVTLAHAALLNEHGF
jgi:hypothetical protein